MFFLSTGNFLGREEDNTKYAYGCTSMNQVEVACGPNEIISITDVAYGGEPMGCGAAFTNKNDCQQPRY